MLSIESENESDEEDEDYEHSDDQVEDVYSNIWYVLRNSKIRTNFQ